jgi:glycosidase
MYNLIDSHDTPRIMSICGDQIEKVKLAYLLQFTFAGAPSVYYGSEVGLAGPEGHNRRCMPWDESKQDRDIRSFVKNLIRLRKRYSVFGEVNLKWLLVDSENQAFIFQKNEDHQRLIVVVNTKADAVMLKIPNELKNKKFKDLFTEKVVELKEVLHLNKFEFRLLLG